MARAAVLAATIGCKRFIVAPGLSRALVISVQINKVTNTKTMAMADPIDTGIPWPKNVGHSCANDQPTAAARIAKTISMLIFVCCIMREPPGLNHFDTEFRTPLGPQAIEPLNFYLESQSLDQAVTKAAIQKLAHVLEDAATLVLE